MQGRLTRAGAVLALLLATAVSAHANSSLGIGNAEVTASPGGPFAGIFLEILAVQRQFFVELREALVSLRDGHGGLAWLAGLSFVYGIFHAAGPGHGKAVLSSYMLANEVALRRGIALSFAAALVQAFSAFAVVALGWFVLRGASLSMTDLASGLELGSYAMIALIGAWLLLRKGWPLLRWAAARVRTMTPAPRSALAFAGRGTFTEAGGGSAAGTMRASGGYGSDVCDDPAGDACDCGRPHMLAARDLEGPSFRWRTALATVVAIGLRPCSGRSWC